MCDYFQCSFKDTGLLPQICELLTKWGIVLTPGRGGNGYRNAFRAFGDAFAVFFDGGLDTMGINLQLKATALRYLQQNGCYLPDLAADCLSMGAKFSRFDLALDSFEVGIGHVFKAAIIDGSVRGAFRQEPKNFGNPCSTDPNAGMTIYCGSTEGQMLFRAYNKAAEQGIGSDTVWTRFEWQYRDDKAQIAAELFGSQSFDQVVGYCRSQVEFCEPSNDSNRSRWQPARWFEYFMDASKMIFRPVDVIKDMLAAKFRWIIEQIMPTLLCLKDAGLLDELIASLESHRYRLKAGDRIFIDACVQHMKDRTKAFHLGATPKLLFAPSLT